MIKVFGATAVITLQYINVSNQECTPQTYTVLYVNSISIKKELLRQKEMWLI